jgi:hypothetical protein
VDPAADTKVEIVLVGLFVLGSPLRHECTWSSLMHGMRRLSSPAVLEKRHGLVYIEK